MDWGTLGNADNPLPTLFCHNATTQGLGVDYFTRNAMKYDEKMSCPLLEPLQKKEKGYWE
jgi:hypothetical protein